MSRLRSLKRAGWAFADQAFSSLTNFGLNIIIARELGVADFGAFALAFATYLVALNIARSIGTEPFVIRYSTDDESAWRRGVAPSTGAALAVGIVGGIGCVLASLLLEGAPAQAFLALGVMLPGLMLQDAWRFAFFALGRGERAFANDAVWAAVLFPALIALSIADAVTVLSAVLAWGGAATVAAAVGCLQARAIPRFSGLRAWVREHGDLIGPFLGENIAISGSKEVVIFGVAGIAGLAAAGALRAGQVLLGPLRVIHTSAVHVGVPEGVRLYRSRPELLPRACAALSGALGLTFAGFGALLLLLPEPVGTAIMGDSWEPARAVLLPLTLSVVFVGFLRGPLIGLRVLEAAKEGFSARIVISVATVVGTLVGAAVAGAVGAAYGMALSSLIGVVIWWWQFLRTYRERRAAPSAPLPPPASGRSAARG